MAGHNLPSKLRRCLGRGKPVPVEHIIKRLEPFDGNKDGAIEKEELSAFFQKIGLGGSWFCNYTAGCCWRPREGWYAREVGWIKIPALAKLIHGQMKLPPPPKKRVRITPEGAQGYEPLENLESYEKRIIKEAEEAEDAEAAAAAAPKPPKDGKPGPRKKRPRRGPSRGAPRRGARARGGRPRRGPRRPGPRR